VVSTRFAREEDERRERQAEHRRRLLHLVVDAAAPEKANEHSQSNKR